MADNEFAFEAVGEVYARALVNLAQKRGVLGAVTEDVRGLGEVLQAVPGMQKFMEAVAVSEEEKMGMIQKVFGGKVEPLTLEVLNAMARRNRLMFLRGMVEAFAAILEKMAGRVDVELTSSQALSGETHERVKAGVARALGQEPIFTTKVDAGLIGGIVLKVGDTLFDGSVATQLERIRKQMERGGQVLQQRAGELVG